MPAGKFISFYTRSVFSFSFSVPEFAQTFLYWDNCYILFSFAVAFVLKVSETLTSQHNRAMGIQGLLRFLKDATKEIHIRDYSGRCVAVDTYCWLHRGAFACADKLAKGQKTDQYVKYCMKFVDMLESYNVRPILVFDGCHLPSKKEVEKQRRERRELYMQKGKQFLREGKVNEARDSFTKCISVTPQMALDVMKAARERQIDCIVAPYEADAQLAYLLKHGYAQAVITEDSDLLCFGCEKVILKMDLTGRAQEVSTDRFQDVKNLQGFTKETFRHMCILSGCDYLPSIKGIGLAKSCKALKLGKNKDIYQMVKKLHQYIKGLDPVEPEYAVGFERADKTFLYQLVIDPKSRKLIPLNPYPPDITGDDVKYAGPRLSDQQALQIAWGNIDINNGKQIGNFDPTTWMKSNNQNKSPKHRTSIWQASYLQKSQPIQEPVTKQDCITKPCTLRGTEAVIDVSKLLESRKRKRGLLNPEETLELCTQKPTADNNETTNVLAQNSDQSRLIEAYKSDSPSKFSLRQRMRRKTSIDKTQVVKSRFFSNVDDGPSFIEQSSASLTEVDETPEKLNESAIPTSSIENDGVLNDILQEMKENVQSEPSPQKRRDPFDYMKSPKKASKLLEKLEEYQRKNEVRTPLIQKTVQDAENDNACQVKSTILKRKKPTPLPPSAKRLLLNSNAGSPRSTVETQRRSKFLKRTVIKPTPILSVTNEDGSREQDLSADSIDCSKPTNVIPSSEVITETATSTQCCILNEDIPILDGINPNCSVASLNAKSNRSKQHVQSNFESHKSEGSRDSPLSDPQSNRDVEKCIAPAVENIITISSDDEDEKIPCIDRVNTRRVSLESKGVSSKNTVTGKSKYFVGTRVSGLRRRKSSTLSTKKSTHLKENQPKISTMFSKVSARLPLTPVDQDSDDDFTPESSNSTDIQKIKAKMVATRKLFRCTPN